MEHGLELCSLPVCVLMGKLVKGSHYLPVIDEKCELYKVINIWRCASVVYDTPIKAMHQHHTTVDDQFHMVLS